MGAAELTELAFEARLPPLASYRFQFWTTSEESKARPLTGALLCHFTPWRKVKTSSVPSAANSHFSARPGTTSVRLDGSPRPGLPPPSQPEARPMRHFTLGRP